ncbi:hypothetical protein SYNTR_2156 [Candidatus Syntrophocurvum alkaliphilum]|uniref:TRAM domain-containing protein n=1 Tax=Candidatus Syntrophocurvum alkaliphilum TaxID=2293317 RepID=A0A6I6DLT1_9FIRM|nr:PIN domain-containing protein [Candidatus Syntrophocurvum alkaliphilum]QGU00750.1 hypothetical protein SYNTR_2156 [Candidatus Syntrophocurvum alkaliphilum]
MHKKDNFSKILFVSAIIFGIWSVYILSMYLNLGIIWQMVLGILSTSLFYITFGWLGKVIRLGMNKFNQFIDNISIEVMLGGTSGLLVGVLVGLLSSYPLSMISGIGGFLTFCTFLFCGFLGLKLGVRRAPEVIGLLPIKSKKIEPDKPQRTKHKVLDTSAIIDGRIYDVCLSNFLEGELVVPTFVIEELQHIADSSDNIRRNKGRRGLELLAKMQKHPEIKIRLMEGNDIEEKEVDKKLIRLCKQINGSIVTNDYNLNKVAQLQGIKVLNINELTNAVKVIVYPGENMQINIIKEGKEVGQGIGYLEDGTMVVVEEAQSDIGKDLEVIVTSVFQTAAGRMIFTRKIKEETTTKDVDVGLQDVQEVNLYG